MDQIDIREPDRTAEVDEFKLPPMPSLVLVLLSNLLMQLTFFIIVSSSNEYAQHLGGTATFSGLVIGIPTAASALTLYPLSLVDKAVYKRPLNFACFCLILGNVLYSLAYRAGWLYLILIGRIVCGGGFTFWMYAKRYCSDPRIVGLRRRTTLAGWQVLGQGVGFSLGPFAGGMLSKISFSNSVFNGFTSPGWIMAALWVVYWICVQVWFEDTPIVDPKPIELDSPESPVSEPVYIMTKAQWGVVATMCWQAMSSFFILGAWEANIPVFTSSNAPANPFHYSPFQAGNMIALGGACTIPFLLLNLWCARRVQDRHTLAVGAGIGLSGLLIAVAILASHKVNFGSFFVAWFLVALGFNIATTATLSLLSKQLPGEWNSHISLAIQCSNYTGRVTGAVWGGAGVKVGMTAYVGYQIAYVGIGCVMFMTLWRNLKAKTG